jgi:hypothetical protein
MGLLGLTACDDSENKRLKTELAALKKTTQEKKSIVQGPVNIYGTAPSLPSIRVLLERPELKGIIVQEIGVSRADAVKTLLPLSYMAVTAAGLPQLTIFLNKEFFDTSFNLINQIKHDADTGVLSKAYSDRYYSKDYSDIVVELAVALLKEGLLIIEAADTSSGCIIKAQSPKNLNIFSLPQEYIFVIQPSEHGIRIFGSSTTKHKFYSFDKPEQSLKNILDKVG